MNKKSNIYIAWHTGLVWWAIVKELKSQWYKNLILRSRQELDLLNQEKVLSFLKKEQPDYIILSAAKVWWIKANMTFPAEFLYENLQIQNNIIWGAHIAWVNNLLFLWSSCIYPRGCKQPIKEEYLMDSKLEPTNEWYALAKISWMKLCEKINEQYGKNFISCMPTNIYGPGDNFDENSWHVIPALIKRMHEAKINGIKEILIWWTGTNRREFLYVDDLAHACVWLMNNYSNKQFLNIWTWEDISIKELAYMIKDVVQYEWELIFDTSKPDWMPLRKLDVSKINKEGWKHYTSLSDWLDITYNYFIEKKIH